MTPEEIMTMVANEHSYQTWDELMNDSHPHWQIACTKEAMERYHEQKLNIHGVMQAEASAGADGAAVGQRSVDTNAEGEDCINVHNFSIRRFGKCLKCGSTTKLCEAPSDGHL